jgi:hypothetical protein
MRGTFTMRLQNESQVGERKSLGRENSTCRKKSEGKKLVVTYVRS